MGHPDHALSVSPGISSCVPPTPVLPAIFSVLDCAVSESVNTALAPLKMRIKMLQDFPNKDLLFEEFALKKIRGQS